MGELEEVDYIKTPVRMHSKFTRKQQHMQSVVSSLLFFWVRLVYCTSTMWIRMHAQT